MTPTRYNRANLHKPPNRILMDEGDLKESRRNWVQPYDLWAIFLFHFEGVLTVSNFVYPFRPGMAAFIPPGRNCEFDRIGAGCMVQQISSNLEGIAEFDIVALPLLVDLGADFEHYAERFRRAHSDSDWTLGTARAFMWELMWHVAKPPSELRHSPSLYDAEKYILDHLDESLQVSDIAEKSQVSASHLLRLFKQEHGMTVQQFIREQRASEARRLLLGSDLQMKEIARRVGMSSLQQFNKLVRYSTGFSPRDIRQRRPTTKW